MNFITESGMNDFFVFTVILYVYGKGVYKLLKVIEEIGASEMCAEI